MGGRTVGRLHKGRFIATQSGFYPGLRIRLFWSNPDPVLDRLITEIQNPCKLTIFAILRRLTKVLKSKASKIFVFSEYWIRIQVFVDSDPNPV